MSISFSSFFTDLKKKRIVEILAKESVSLDEADHFRKELPSDQLGEFVYWTEEIEYSTGIPFNYSIGIGLIFFITAIGIVTVSLIGRKGRTS